MWWEQTCSQALSLFISVCVIRLGSGPAPRRAWEDSPRDLDEWTTRHQHRYSEPQQILLTCSQNRRRRRRGQMRRQAEEIGLECAEPKTARGGSVWQLCLHPRSGLTEQEGFQTSRRRSCRLKHTLLPQQQSVNSGALVKKPKPKVIVCLSLRSQAGDSVCWHTFTICTNAAIKWFHPVLKEMYPNLT